MSKKKSFKFIGEIDYEHTRIPVKLKIVLPPKVKICVWRKVRVIVEEI